MSIPTKLHILSLSSLLLASASSLSAAAIIYEPFGQTAGSISGKAGGTGLNNWAVVSTASTVATTPTLAYGELASSDGQLSIPNGGGITAYVTTTAALTDNNLLIDGATLWFSFVYSKAAGGGSNERSGFAFGTDHLVSNSTTGAFMSNSGNGLGVFTKDKTILPMTWNGGGSGVTAAGTSFTNFNDTVYVVGRIVWGATAGDLETLTIWSPNEASPPVDAAALGAGFSKTMAAVDQTAFDTISMQQRNSGGAIIYDEIRFGATFQDVVVTVPEPSSALLGAFGFLALLRRRK